MNKLLQAGIKTVFILFFLAFLQLAAFAQVPTISYGRSQTYYAGTAITPLTPAGAGVAAPGYSSTITTVASGLGFPINLTVDAAGNIYVAGYGNGDIEKIPVGSNTATNIVTGLSEAAGVAIDGAGNFYVAEQSNPFVKIAAGSTTPVQYGPSFSEIIAVGVDAAGNVYVEDAGTQKLTEIYAGGSTSITLTSGLGFAYGLALDPSGNVYVADDSGNHLWKVPAGGGTPIAITWGGSKIDCVAVDAAGNVYTTSENDHSVYEIPASTGTPVLVASGLTDPLGIAVDPSGNLLVMNESNGTISKISPVGGYYISPDLPPGLVFNSTTGTISGTPTTVSQAANYTVTAWNSSGKTSEVINIGVAFPVATPALDILGLTTSTPATGAYSLRLLNSTYLGPLVRIYMNSNYYDVYPDGSSGKAFSLNSPFVQKISATDPVTGIGSSSLSTITGSNSATVVTWFDQSGNGNNATQATQANQPAIITSGVINASPSLPGMAFNGNSTYLRAVLPSLNATTPHTLNAIAAAYTGSIVALSSASAGYQNSVLGAGDNNGTEAWYGGYGEDAAFSVGVSTTNLAERTKTFSADTITGYFNGAPVFTQGLPAYNLSSADIIIGVQNNGTNQFLSGSASEVLVFTSALSTANRQTVENNQIAYYGITPAPTTISSLTLTGATSPTSASSLNYNAVFATAVTGLTAGNFSLAATGTAAGTIGSVTGSGANWTVNITGITGNGTLTLSYVNSIAVSPGVSNSFSAAPVTILIAPPTLSYTGPQSYFVGTAIAPLTPNSTGLAAQGYSAFRVSVGSRFSVPEGLAADASGNIFVASYGTNQIIEIHAADGSSSVYASGIILPSGLARDAAGNIYVIANGSIMEIKATDQSVVTMGSGFNNPSGIAADAAGNVYVADLNISSIQEIRASDGSQISVGSGFNEPCAVAVDQAGNLYVGTDNTDYIQEIKASDGSLVTLPPVFNTSVSVLAVDASGNVFAGFPNNATIQEIPAGSSTSIAVGTATSDFCLGIAIDGSGNMYNTDPFYLKVYETVPVGGFYLNTALPAGLTMNQTTGIISGTPTTVTPAANYTITGWNGGGSAAATVNIGVAFPVATPALDILGLTTATPATGAYSLRLLNSTYQGPLVRILMNGNYYDVYPDASAAKTFSLNSPFVQQASATAAVTSVGSSSLSTVTGSNSATVVTWFDQSGNSNDATQSASGSQPTIIDVGVINISPALPGMRFNGSSTYLRAVLPSLNAATPHTLNGVVSATGTIVALSSSSAADQNSVLGSGDGNGTAAWYGGYNEDGSYSVGITTTALAERTKTYVPDTIKGYFNGAPVFTQAAPAYNLTTADIVIGAQNNGQNQLLYGSASEVLVFTSALSDADRQTVESNQQVYYNTPAPTTISSITLTGVTSPTSASTLTYNAVFASAVTGITASNFSVTTTGNTVATIGSVTGSGTIWTVNLTGISGDGTVTLNYLNTISVSPGVSNAFSAAPVTVLIPAPTLSYSSPQTYSINTAISPLTPTSTGVAAQGYNIPRVGIGSQITEPVGVAIDASGNVFVAAEDANRIDEIHAADGSTSVYASEGLLLVSSLAIDAAGNIYAIVLASDSPVKEIKATDQSIVSIGSGFVNPTGIATDAAGNVYVADQQQTTIQEIRASDGSQISLGSGLNQPDAVAVDKAGNVYVGSLSSHYIQEIKASDGTVVTLPPVFSGYVTALAADASGNVFVEFSDAEIIQEIPAGSSTAVAIGTATVNDSGGITLDAAGNLYNTDPNSTVVYKTVPSGGFYLNTGLPAGLSLNQTTGVISGTPTTVTPAANYTITGWNGGGSISATVNIGVAFPVTTPALDILGLTTATPATGAFSLRLLNSTYQGPLVRILMNSNYYDVYADASAAKAFSLNSPFALQASATSAVTGLGSSSLSTITGSNSATVVTWFDQSGNGNNATQATQANQPAIITSGVINTSPSLPGIAFNGSSTYLRAVLPSLNATTPHTLNGIAAASTGTIVALSSASAGDQNSALGAGDGNGTEAWYGGYYEDTQYSVGVSTTSLAERTKTFSADTITGYFNGAPVFNQSAPAYNLTSADIVIGVQNDGTNQFLNGSASEVLVFTSALSTADRQTVENNQIAYYGITPAPTTISSLTLTGATSPTNASSINYNAVFASAVSGLTTSNFTVTATGTATGSIAGVSGSGTNWTVNLTGVGGSGTLTLNYVNTAAVSPGVSNALSASPVTTLPAPTLSYSSPQTYITNTAITPLTPTSTGVAAQGYNSSPVTVSTAVANNYGLAVDAAGNIYVTSGGAVSKIPAGGGAVSVTSVQLGSQPAVAVDAAGNIYLTGGINTYVIEIKASDGSQVQLGSSAGFVDPSGVAVDAAGNVYVTDAGKNTVTEIPAGNGAVITLGSGFSAAVGIAVDAAGNVYVADRGHNAVKEIPAGNGAVVTLGSGFTYPTSVAVDAVGNVFVSSANAGYIKEIPVGNGTIDDLGSGFANVTGLAADAAGNVYVSDNDVGTIYKITPSGGYYLSSALPAGLTMNQSTGTISGTPTTATAAANYLVTAWNGGGSAAATVNIAVTSPPPTVSYNSPQTYITNTAITPLTPANSGVAAPAYSSTSTNLGPAYSPLGLAVDASGNVFFVDNSDGNGTINEINAATSAKSVYATGFGGTVGVAVDAAGNVYLANQNRSEVQEIKAADKSVVNIGSGFQSPQQLAVDGAGNVYVADSGLSGIIEVRASDGSVISLGTGISNPIAVAVDHEGNIYFSTANVNQVQEISAGNGTMVTLAPSFSSKINAISVDAEGNLLLAFNSYSAPQEIAAGSGVAIGVGPATTMSFGAAIDPAGNLYSADNGTGAIFKTAPVGGYYLYSALPAGLSFNQTTGVISGTPTTATVATNYNVTAWNTIGGTTATVNITVNVPVPTLSYSSPQTYITNTAITPLTPTSTGVAAQGYNSSPVIVSTAVANNDGLAVDAAGNIYVTSGQAVSKIPAGGGAISVTSVQLGSQTGVAVDAAGNVYLAGNNNPNVIEIKASDGSQVQLGSGAGFVDPSGVAVDAAGNVYVTDAGNNTVTEIPAGNGAVITLGSGFYVPEGIALDAAGNVYVADRNHNAVKEIPAGNGAVVTLGSGFTHPQAVAVDAAGNVFVSSEDAGYIKEIPAGNGTIVDVGSGFSNVTGVAVDAAGTVYVSDHIAAIYKITPTGGYYLNTALPAGLTMNQTTGIVSGTPTTATAATNYQVTGWNGGGSAAATVNIAVNVPAPTLSYSSPQTYIGNAAITPLTPTSSGVAAQGYSSSRLSLGAGFGQPYGVAVDSSGNIFVADEANKVIDEINAVTGITSIYATGFSSVNGIAIDAAGNIYVADQIKHEVIELPAGAGTLYNVGLFTLPFAVAVDAAGNIYVADLGQTSIAEIRASDHSFVSLGSGFNQPDAVAVDAAGNVYVGTENTDYVQEIKASDGTVVTLPPVFNSYVSALAVDASGNLFAGLSGVATIQEITAGSSTAVAIGTATTSSSGGIAIDAAGNLYNSDAINPAVYKTTPTGGYYLNKALPAGLAINQTTGVISGTPTTVTAATNYQVTGWNSGGSAAATVNIAVYIPAPTLSYSSPQTYTTGTTITPLTPTSTGVAAPGYNSSLVTVGTSVGGSHGVAADAAGNIYVACFGRLIEIPAGGGAFSVTGIELGMQAAVAVDAAGNIYLTGGINTYVIEIKASDGSQVQLGSSAGFVTLSGVAVDAAGNVYVTDNGNNTVKEIPAGNGAVVTLGSGFQYPTGIAVDAAGNVYVADRNNNAVKEIPAGNGTVVTLGSGFTHPQAVAVDATGNVFVSSQEAAYVKEIPAGNGAVVDLGSVFGSATGVAVDAAGNVYVINNDSYAIYKITPTGGYYLNTALPAGLIMNQTTGTISGTPTTATAATNYQVTGWNGGGSAAATVNITVNVPAPTLSYSSPQTYITNTAITPLTPTSTGVAAPGYNTPRVAIASALAEPEGLGVDASGNVFVATEVNNTIQEIHASDGSVSVYASGINHPFGIAVDAAGNVYVAGHDGVYEIKAADQSVVSLGSGFNSPNGIAVDAAGNVYVADEGQTSIVEIRASDGSLISLGSGFNQPLAVAVDPAGNVYVGTNDNDYVQEIKASDGSMVTLPPVFTSKVTALAVDVFGNLFVELGNASTIQEIPVGSSTALSIGTALVIYSSGVALDGAGNLYNIDPNDERPYKTAPSGGFYLNTALPAGLSLNQTTGIISGTPTTATAATNYQVTGWNGGGSAAATVNIAVTSPPPTVSSITATTPGNVNPTNATSVTYTVTFSEAVTGVDATDFTLNNSGTTGSVTAVSGSGSVYTVTVGGISGNGTLQLVLISTGDPITAAGGTPLTTGFTTGDTNTIDNIPPTVTVGPPSVSYINSTATVSYTVTWSDPYLNTNTISLAPSQLQFSGAGYLTNPANITISGSGATRNILITGVTGNGPMSFSIPAGTAQDYAGNTAAASNTATTVVVDNTPPAAAIGAPSLTTVGNSGATSVTYAVTYSDANFGSSSLSTGNITLNTTATATGTIGVSGSGTSYTVTISDITGLGTLGISIAGGVATDLAGNMDAGAGPSATFNVISSDATLSSLTLSSGILSPGFSGGVTGYNATVPFGTTSITVTPATNNAGATVTVDGGPASTPVTLNAGTTTVDVLVTAPDGVTKQLYTIAVVIGVPSSDASLSNLTVSTGSLKPAFSSTTTEYAVFVPYGTSSIAFTPTTTNAYATALVNSGPAVNPVTLVTGPNTVYVAVTAQDGVTQQTYTVTVDVAEPSTDATLSNLSLSSGSLNPTFSSSTTGYAASVPYGTTSITVTPTTNSAFATALVNGSSPATPVNLNIGPNTINVLVTAQDGVTQQTYTVTVTEAASPSDATLSNFSFSVGTHPPTFVPGQTKYADTLNTSISAVSITPYTTSSAATVTINGVTVASGSPSLPIALFEGQASLATIVVTSGDGTAHTTYIVTLSRLPSTNAHLAFLSISNHALSPVFVGTTTGYTASVLNTVSSVTLKPIVADANATVTINGIAVASGALSPAMPLVMGSNTINVVVTSQGGTMITYTVMVTRAPSAVATLSSLTLSRGGISPGFGPAKMIYTAEVGEAVSSITETPATTDTTATIMVNGVAVTSGTATNPIPLNIGTNTITTVVTAGDGSTTDTYTVTVTRVSSANAKLGFLGLSHVVLSPAFINTNTTYTASVPNTLTSTNVLPIVVDTTARITVNQVPVASGSSTPVTLNVGENVISTVVTAQDGVTQITYTVTVTRAAPTAAYVVFQPVSVEQPTDSVQLVDDGIVVHQGVSPNGDGIDDYLRIDGITQYPDNKLTIINRSGMLIYEAKGYDNSSRLFDGHSNKNGQMQLPGTYFYSLDYTVGGVIKHRTGYIVLKY